MCDPRLLVNEFSFIQVTELGPIKTHPEIGSKHPLMTLEGKHREDFISVTNRYDISNIFFLIMVRAFYWIFIVKNALKTLV